MQNRRQKVFNRGLWDCARGLDTPKIDKNSSDLWCFMFQFGGFGALLWGDKPPKAPRGDGTELMIRA